jgi:hypothetical protein
MAPTTTAEDAAKAVLRYREPHVIQPETSPNFGTYCGHCGIGIYTTVKGHLHHDNAEIARLCAVGDRDLLYPMSEATR